MKRRTEKPQNSSTSNNHPTQISELKYLPPEIWTRILEKLPAKNLLIFRCVCKSWCFIIDHPDFIHLHLQLSQIPNSGNNNNNKSLLALDCLEIVDYRSLGCLLTVRHAETLRETGLIFRKPDLYTYRMIGSCNGLILVSRNDGSPPFRKELRLWNPCIRKSLVIPACPFTLSLLPTSVYLFGYAPISKDYKIVAIVSVNGVGEEPKKMYVAVYTLCDQQWTVRNDSFPNALAMVWPFYCVRTAVFLKGVAYWLGNVGTDRSALTHLGSFDFDKEEIAFLELPSSWVERNSFRHLFLLGDSLAIFRISEVASSIWVLDQDNKKRTWAPTFSGNSSQNGRNVFRSLSQKVFFCESDGGYFICGNKSYNIASCEVQEYNCFNSFYVELEMYSESLVLSNGYGACDLRFFP